MRGLARLCPRVAIAQTPSSRRWSRVGKIAHKPLSIRQCYGRRFCPPYGSLREAAMQRLYFALALALGALGLDAGHALGQGYPSKPIRIVVPFAPGGGVDVLARLVSAKLPEFLGQPVIVEHRPGAGGNIGADAVAKAAPDGYTILLTTSGHAMSPALYRALPFDAAKDFVPVTQVIASTLVLVANPKLPAASARDLIALAKAKPGSLNYGSSGPDAPPVAESGLPGFAFAVWNGMFVPANTPRDVVAAIQRAVARALATPEVGDRIRAVGNEPIGSTPEEFDAQFKADLVRFAKIVRDANIPTQD